MQTQNSMAVGAVQIVGMSMMQVRKVRVRMGKWNVTMAMDMRLAGRVIR